MCSQPYHRMGYPTLAIRSWFTDDKDTDKKGSLSSSRCRCATAYMAGQVQYYSAGWWVVGHLVFDNFCFYRRRYVKNALTPRMHKFLSESRVHRLTKCIWSIVQYVHGAHDAFHNTLDGPPVEVQTSKISSWDISSAG